MKILYISSLILKKSSSASIRNTGLIKGLLENGIKVDIMIIKYPEELEDNYLKEKLKNIKKYFCELKILNKYLKLKNKNVKNKTESILSEKLFIKLKNLMKNFIKDIYFFPDVDKEWIKEFEKLNINYKDYDLIISSSDTKTSHYIGEKIKEQYPEIPWFQIWGDPWGNDIGLKGLRKIFAKLKEKRLLEKANLIFYVSPFTLKETKNRYKNLENKIKYLPRGFLEEVYKEKSEKREIIISYTGVLNQNRNISNFIQLIENYNIKNIQKIKLNIYGNIDNNVLKDMKRFSCIEYFGNISFEKIKNVYKQSDYLLFVDNGKNTTQIPGKIYDYLGTNNKIICLFREKSEIYEYFKKELGLLVYLENEIDITSILSSPERNVDERFSNKIIAKKLINYYMEMNK